MSNREALQKLKIISNDLHEVDYEYILGLFKTNIRKIPIPIAKLDKFSKIDRARKNNGDILFHNVDQLSYVKDKNVTERYLTEFGRANKPHNPMFYGALYSSVLDNQIVTAIAETSKLFQDPNGRNMAGELYTLSRWQTNSELLVAEVVFSKDAIKNNPDIKNEFEKQTKLAKDAGEDDIDFYIDFLGFISDQFARETKSHNDYKISAAYTELVLTNPKISGVTFPSVQTKYMGVNIVFPPSVVDENLEVLCATTRKLYKNKKKTLITNHKKCLNINESPNNLQWEDTEIQFLTREENIKKYFRK